MDGSCTTIFFNDPANPPQDPAPAGNTTVASISFVGGDFNGNVTGLVGRTYTPNAGTLLLDQPHSLLRAIYTEASATGVAVRTFEVENFTGTSMACNGGAAIPFTSGNNATLTYRWCPLDSALGRFQAGVEYSCLIFRPE